MKERITEDFAKKAIAVLTAFTVLATIIFFFGARAYQASAAVPSPEANKLEEQLEIVAELQVLRSQLESLEQENTRLAGQNEEITKSLDTQDQITEELVLEYAGEFHTTAYCCEVYPHICGGNGVTASGTVPTPGITCAADWSRFPPGTWLYIQDVGIRRVEDSGSAIKGNRLDIAVDTHENALRWPGFGSHHVWVLAWGE